MIRQVQLGMSSEQVRHLMGEPQTVIHFAAPTLETAYHYQHRPGTSDSYQIRFDRWHYVSDITIAEGVN